MTQIDEQELDKLLAEAVARQVLADEMVGRVRRTLRQQQRRAAWRRWTSIVVLSFGVPLLLVAVVAEGYHLYQLSGQPLFLFGLLCPVVAVLFCARVATKELIY